MFIAHLPAGYLLTSRLVRKHPTRGSALLAVGLVCSVLPDIDLVHFYLIDHRRHVHHDYLTHTPFFWLAVAALLALGSVLAGKRQWLVLVWAGLLNVLLHLVLDTVAADIRWLFPFSDMRMNLVHVPALHQPWFLNFILHWTFLCELAIIIVAIVMFVRKWHKGRSRVPQEAALG
ncbi:MULTISPECIES: metal-dependent hydrolase [unclassified Sinorhizobium]|uniref:metal-dependent hydrolase n=1 Tax=unclassified Sinorhizobium TaxID=2613772 RepID=UPI0035236034